jgi:hypothetical protein
MHACQEKSELVLILSRTAYMNSAVIELPGKPLFLTQSSIFN